MSKISFNEVVLRVRRSGKCSRCDKRTRRVYKLWQTLNPFNRNDEGLPKTRTEIKAELERELRQIRDSALLCSRCESNLVTEICEVAPLLHDIVGDDGPRAASALMKLSGGNPREEPICRTGGDRGTE